jgi:5'-methylthioadenosine phosphorylase
VLGIIGGSGLYEMDGLEDVRSETVASPWGAPSAPLVRGRLHGVPIAFLPRHGPGHARGPSDVDYRANVDALKRAGVTDVLSLSACGSLREELAPGAFVLVDQFVDRTFARAKSFFGAGCVAHVSMARPVCARLGEQVAAAAADEGIPVRRGGTYLAMEGPQFSSLAESRLYRSWGCDVIGMTNMPEAKLAREAELCYATVAMVTDYDCWHEEHGPVEVAHVLDVLRRNAARARALVARVAARYGERPVPCPERCDRALDAALVTAPEARDPVLLRKLDAVAGRVLANA